jgi:hypothetical protein
MGNRLRAWLAASGRILLFVALLALPSIVRAGYYYRRSYKAVEVPRPDLSDVEVSEVEVSSFVDAAARQSRGRVVVDRAHGNTLDDAELNVVLARLTARGLETISLIPGDDLDKVLRTAVALVVISPHEPFSAQETEAVKQFVRQGGRILLAADPSRYALEFREDEMSGEVLVAESDVAAINGMASAFGLAFADDYLYNTQANAGNYQYVIARDFAESPVTVGLERIIFYAARSLTTSEEPLISADDATTSSLRERNDRPVMMGLGGNGQALAVGDFTFMTEPYNTAADNDRLVANIADFLAGASRTFGLAEFPYFFGEDVDLFSITLEAGDRGASIKMVEGLSSLEAALESEGKTLHWRGQPNAEHDLLYVGLYGGLLLRPEVGDLLAQHGITFTLETAEQQAALLTATPTPQPTLDVTPTVPTATPRPLRDWVHFPGIGPVDAREAALFYQNEEDGRQVLILVASNEAGLRSAVDRLLAGDYAGCLLDDDREGDPEVIGLALCPTVYEAPEDELAPTPTPSPEGDEATPTPPAAGSILIVSDDDGEGAYEWWNSAYQLYDVVLNAGYEPVVWSTNLDGEVTLEQMASYNAVLWCTGDYQAEGGNPSEEEMNAVGEYLTQGGSVLLIGAFLGDPEDQDRGLLLDIQLDQADHPLAQGFEPEEVITLERFTAEEDYVAYVMSDVDADAVVWTRGPQSEFPGEAAIVVLEDDLSGGRLAMVGVPLYLLPYDEADQLGTNIVLWLVRER